MQRSFGVLATFNCLTYTHYTWVLTLNNLLYCTYVLCNFLHVFCIVQFKILKISPSPEIGLLDEMEKKFFFKFPIHSQGDAKACLTKQTKIRRE